MSDTGFDVGDPEQINSAPPQAPDLPHMPAKGSTVGMTVDRSLRGPNKGRGKGETVVITEDAVPRFELTLGRELSSDSYAAFTAFAPADGRPVQILADDELRSRAVITNDHASAYLLVGKFTDVSAGVGYSLAPGKSLEVKVNKSVYIKITDSGTVSVPCPVWVERA